MVSFSLMAIPAFMGLVEVSSDFTRAFVPALYAGTAPGVAL
jgi:hypothetical protein